MKTGFITTPNSKGQIVIPKEVRKQLGISPTVALNIMIRGSGMYIHPIFDVVSPSEHENSYMHILKKTRGTWSDDNWSDISKKRRDIELKASQQRKKVW